jgi:ADP-ribose pyrophosphatase
MLKDITHWKTLSSKALFEHPEMTIVQDTVLLPNGETSTYIRKSSTTHHSVIIIAINNSGDVLLQREYSHPPATVLWQLPGGSMKDGETTEQAALRELAEESGVGAHNVRVIGYYYTHNRTSDQKQFVVECTDLFEHKLAEDADEFIESSWLSRGEIEELIAHGDIHNINLLAALNMWQHKHTTIQSS